MATSEIFITDINTLDTSKIKWSITTQTVKQGNASFKVHRASPSVFSATGQESPLIVVTDKVFTYGVSESSKQEGDGFTYSIPLCMYDMNGATAHQEKFVAACDKISQSGRKFLLDNAAAFNKDWIDSDLRNVSILWYAKESKKPTLYAKLPMRKDKIECDFIQPYKKKGQVYNRKLNPLMLRDVRCHVKAAVRIESIFIGAKVTFQTKVYELIVFPTPEKVNLLSLTSTDAADLPEEEEDEEESENEQKESDEPRTDTVGFLEIRGPVDSYAAAVVAEPSVAEEMPKPRRGRKQV